MIAVQAAVEASEDFGQQSRCTFARPVQPAQPLAPLLSVSLCQRCACSALLAP